MALLSAFWAEADMDESYGKRLGAASLTTARVRSASPTATRNTTDTTDDTDLSMRKTKLLAPVLVRGALTSQGEFRVIRVIRGVPPPRLSDREALSPHLRRDEVRRRLLDEQRRRPECDARRRAREEHRARGRRRLEGRRRGHDRWQHALGRDGAGEEV